MKQHGLVAMKQRQGHNFIGDTMKKYILYLRDHTKRIISGDIEGEIVFGALLGAYIVDIVFYGENNIGIVCVVIIVGLFRWLRSMDE